ncbi:regulatory protein GemA [Aliikangiella maris]|uniref:Regulatory protein GemA n=2 Tax=Aliikangiella maris TaxID=3162458 RepID=A0ABV2BTE5_9GAMM
MYLSKHYYIKLIGIGKEKLSLDNFAYTRLLQSLTGKTNAEQMDTTELMQVLNKMQWMGYKIQKEKKSLRNNGASKKQLKRLRQLWFLMFLEGYLNESCDKSLLSWSQRKLKIYDESLQIDHLAWFPDWVINGLIDELENWHKMLKIYFKIQEQ